MAEAEQSRSRARLREPGPWLALVAFWSILPLATVSLMDFAIEQSLPHPRLLVYVLVVWLPWAPLTRGITELGRLFQIRGPRALKHASIHFLASWLVALFVGLYTAWITALIPPWEQAAAAGVELVAGIGADAFRIFEGVGAVSQILYWSILSVSSGLVWYQRSSERANLLAEARLQALKAQIQPHFLFNTLNTIADLMEDDVPAAREMIARLGELLRNSLERSSAQEVRLEAELKLVRSYLAIEQVRFEDRLRVSIDIADKTRRAWVPHLLLQPLVENAIQHGICRDASAGEVRIEAMARDGVLTLKVHDDGPGPGAVRPVSVVSSPGGGIGLSNLKVRIAELYGSEGKLELLRRRPRGATALVELPFRLEPIEGRR